MVASDQTVVHTMQKLFVGDPVERRVKQRDISLTYQPAEPIFSLSSACDVTNNFQAPNAHSFASKRPRDAS